MEVNPYETPREVGYDPPRVRSRWWDFVACVGTGLVIHVVLQAVLLAAWQAYRISGVDWSREFKTIWQIALVGALGGLRGGFRFPLVATKGTAAVSFFGCVLDGYWRGSVGWRDRHGRDDSGTRRRGRESRGGTESAEKDQAARSEMAGWRYAEA